MPTLTSLFDETVREYSFEWHPVHAPTATKQSARLILAVLECAGWDTSCTNSYWDPDMIDIHYFTRPVGMGLEW